MAQSPRILHYKTYWIRVIPVQFVIITNTEVYYAMKLKRDITSLFIQLIVFFSLIVCSCEREEYCSECTKTPSCWVRIFDWEAPCPTEIRYETLCDDNLRRLERDIARKENWGWDCEYPHIK